MALRTNNKWQHLQDFLAAASVASAMHVDIAFARLSLAAFSWYLFTSVSLSAVLSIPKALASAVLTAESFLHAAFSLELVAAAMQLFMASAKPLAAPFAFSTSFSSVVS